jgi:phosphoglycerate dehydrogenase-like enzyme
MNVLVAIYSPFAAWNIPDAHIERLRREFPHHAFVHARSDEDVPPHLADAEIAFASELREPHFRATEKLRWVHSPAAGVGGMLSPTVVSGPVVFSNSRGMSGETIAEHVLGLALALFRKFPLAMRAQRAHEWTQDEAMQPPPLRMIKGTQVLLIGLGGIGAACAVRFAALGARVTAIRRRTAEPSPPGVSAVHPPGDLLRLLPAAELIVVAAPQTTSTQQMIGREQLAAMRPDAVLINVSRGKLVDEAALAAVLWDGAIAGAGLDVFEHEPLDPSSPLWDLPNVIITPHTSGFRPDHWDAATDLFAENLRRFDRGEPLLNAVDKRAGY